MKKVFPFIFILFFSCNTNNNDCGTYYLIRHAEKVRLDPENKDPELNAEDLRLSLNAIGNVTGKYEIEKMLDIVFKDFCIGK